VFDLARLIHPTPPGVFFAEHWDSRPLLVQRGDPRYFAALFTIDDVEPLLASYGPPGEHDLRLVKRGGSPSTILLPAGTPPDLAAIHAAYQDGYTVNVNDMVSRHPALRRMAHAVLGDLGARARPNLFLTPPGSRAFDLHFDTHDLMILQLGGKKEWRVYGRVEENPTAKHSDGASVPREAVGAPLIDTVLEAGDLIYVPRGFVHEAYTGAEHSLHVTLGLRMGTYHDLLGWMTEVAGFRSPKLRASIPPGALLGRSRAELKQEMLGLLRSEVGEALVDEAIASWAAFELERMVPVDGPTFTPRLEPELALEETLDRPAGSVCVVTASGGRARLVFQGGSVEGPWKIKPALEHVARSESVRPRDLPGALDAASKLVLARRMVREGLLRRRRA